VSDPVLDELLQALRCLPGVGSRTAQRMALHLLERDRRGGQRLAEVLDSVLAKSEVSVTFGTDLDDPGLRHCAVVAAPYGGDRGDPARGALGVIGPSRMDYARIIPLVRYCSRLVTERLKP
jgi:transcriptional regulator of heat shock response